ncbi:hypothetical protein [Klebsiella aerogenes]|uniref:hypothetical protein n=1 Tax=Klebsiella aerogenes TaxID=548 RepID=UPI000ABE67BC|nr:hypothetical protein [Klebsiella aerogenes]
MAPVTRGLAERIESRFGTSSDWLTTGDGMMFPLVILGAYSGDSWEEFFFPDDDQEYVFEFIRIDGGHHNGTLYSCASMRRTVVSLQE